jgi:hypothetical protein
MNLICYGKSKYRILGKYFSEQPFDFYDEKKNPNTCKLIKLCWQQTKAEIWEEGLNMIFSEAGNKALQIIKQPTAQLDSHTNYVRPKTPL